MIKTLDQDCKAWDDFVMTRPEATFFHLSGWRQVIEQAFGHKTYYFYYQDDDGIAGILPLAHINSPLFGNALTSLSFCVYGGILARTEEARNALDSHAVELAKKLKVDHLELRYQTPQSSGRPVKDLYVTFRKEISADPEQNLSQIPRKQRAMVRKAIKAGLTSVVDDDVERLYACYSESVRNLGTPVFSKRYFQTLKQVFPQQTEILTVEHQGRAITSVMSFYFKNQVLPYYGGGIDAARALQGNDFMYWEVMRRAAERGITVFDYGRSKEGTGSYRFKKHWGFEPEPLYYEFELIKAKDLPDINPLNPKYRLFIAAWQRLPLKISQLIGPWLARDLG